MEKLKQASGNWVNGERFWDRQEDLLLLSKRLDDGANVLLVAQRRMGKTSLMHETIRRIRDNYVCLFVDLQKAAKPADAIAAIALAIKPFASIWKKAAAVFGNILKEAANTVEEIDLAELGIKLKAGMTSGTWAEKGDRLLQVLADMEKPVVLMMDEVPICINRILKGDEGTITPARRVEADAFMSWLRENTLRHKGKIRFVVSGSIGFEPVLHQAGISATLNTFQSYELKPWDPKTAEQCIEALANEYQVNLGEGAAAEMVRRLACCIPHHVQMFFAHVYERCVRRGRMEFFKDEVEDVYRDEMLSIRGHAELTHYEERLKSVLGDAEYRLALEMLTEAAVNRVLSREAMAAFRDLYGTGGFDAMEAQRTVLNVLEHDGYLQHDPDGQGYSFVSHLLRDWWEKRYKEFFTPVLERGV